MKRRDDDNADDDCCRPLNVNNLDGQFDEGYSSGQLDLYRREGLGRRARLIVDFLQARGLEGRSVLDIGGGIGALHLELLKAGASRAIGVDASSANVETACLLAEELGLTDRVDEIHGDFLERQNDVPVSDIVTLDRAICCYPAVADLLSAAAGRARSIIGISMPRRTPWMRVGIRLIDVMLAITRHRFRVYYHSPKLVDGTLQAHGFRKVYQQPTGLWETIIYERAG